MPEFTAPDVTIPQTGPDDPRVGALLARRVAEGVAPRVVIVGFPSDEGVRRNGGRVGAAGAPDRIRRVLVLPAGMGLDEVLVAMQRARTHVAAVVDRDGRWTGLATLEDVLESVVGDIIDETDS